MKSAGELLLMTAYGVKVRRRERCLCNGLITADALDGDVGARRPDPPAHRAPPPLAAAGGVVAMRIRQIRPEFVTDPVTAHLAPAVQVTYIGLWCAADDGGWLRWDVAQLGALIYPYKSGHVRTQLVTKTAEILVGLGKLRIEKCGCALIPTLIAHQKLGGNRSYVARDRHMSHRISVNLGSLDESGQVWTSPAGKVSKGKAWRIWP